MSELIKEKYSLGVWERKPSKLDNFIMIIGSDSMTSPYRATTPHIKTKVNGEKILTFTLYSRYFDNDIGEFVDNPFINYLHNETLIKLHRGNNPEENWDEFIIKDISEDSQAKSFTYTAKGAHALELGKTGYSLTFNQELMNNTGTVTQLGEKVVEGTEWEIDIDGSDKLWGAKPEPVYELMITTINSNNVKCIRTAAVGDPKIYNNNVDPNTQTILKPQANAIIYVPYSSYENFEETNELQFLWNPDGIYEVDNEGVIYTANSYIWEKANKQNFLGTGNSNEVTLDLTKKGDLLQNQNKTVYLKGIDKVVSEGKIGDEDAYHFVETSYLTSDTVQEIIVNGSNFETTNGWRNIESNTSIYLNFETSSMETIVNKDFVSKLTLDNSLNSEAKVFYNAAVRSNISILSDSQGITKNDTFILKTNFSGGKDTYFLLAKYKTKSSNETKIVEIEEEIINEQLYPNVQEYSVKASKSVSHTDLASGDYGIFIKVAGEDVVELISLSLYKKIKKNDKEFLSPSDVPESSIINKDFYLLKKDYDETKSFKDTKFYALEAGESFISDSYGSDYEKITSIDISKSNRFNIIQEICEAFKCWADFKVTHDAIGNIESKKIAFKRFIGDNRDIGFSYGLNLKGVKRNLVSDQIVTKLIVEQNNNELAENGFCTIVRAKDNKPKTNFIYDFSYYINQNILLESDIKEDFYGSGLLRQIGTKNKTLLKYNEELIALEKSEFFCEKNIASAKEIKEAAEIELERLKNEFKDYTNMEYDKEEVSKDDFEHKDNDKVKELVFCITIQQNLVDSYSTTLTNNEDSLKTIKDNIATKEEDIKTHLSDVNKLITELENKYAAFIQEGTWIDEGYYDDNLYFYDANIILHTSAFPKVSYTIDVIDLSPFGNEYTPYKFKIGDKTYVEDTEFFGWNQANANPYREEVVISEIDEYLEAPEQNKITVQNYKTQFEDLFQRVAATTQSLQYAAGAYQKAANKITDNNEFDFSTLQNSIMAGALSLQNMGNLSVSWTEEGLIVSSQDSSQAHKKLRLSNTGLDLSVDGGQTWRTAITGTGITADEITTGSLNANRVSIKSGNAATFMWDARGLRAYETNWIGNQVSSVNYNNYIEFNENGLIAYKQNLVDPEKGPIIPFSLTSDGNLTLTGVIHATEGGTIGGWNIGTDNLFSEGVGISSNSSNLENLAFWAGLGEGVITPVFYVNYKGHLYAKDAEIEGIITAKDGGYIGNWAIIEGKLSSVDKNSGQGIILDAANSQIYSNGYVTSTGGTGWSITNDEAIFNNITLRGALKCAVLEYAEIQAVGGIMMIRPATTIKSWKKTITETSVELALLVENSAIFNVHDWCKFASEIEDFENRDFRDDETGAYIIESGINTNLFELKEKRIRYIEVENEKTGEIETKEVTFLIFRDTNKEAFDELTSKNLEGMGLISLGTIGSVGLGLNSSDNGAMIPPTSFSVFELKNDSTTGSNWKYLQPHVILGKIPNHDIYGAVKGKYGLYADAAEITGAIHATTLTLGNSGNSIFSVSSDGKTKIDSDYLNTDSIEESISDVNALIASTNEKIVNLEGQIAGDVSTWFGEGDPNNMQYPWPSEDKPEKHLGDLYYDRESGSSYRFVKEGSKYKWIQVKDTMLTQALAEIDELRQNYNSIQSSLGETNNRITDLGNNAVQVNQEYTSTEGSVTYTTIIAKKGLLTASNAIIDGEICSEKGTIGGWKIEGGILFDLSTSVWLSPSGTKATINGIENAMVFKAGSKFGVAKDGTLYATEANIAGKITATEGTVGSWNITTKGIYNSAMPMNPNILVNSDEKIVNNKRLINSYDVIKQLESGKDYTVSICLERPSDVEEYWIYLSNGNKLQIKFIMNNFKPDSKGRYTLEGTFKASYADGKTPADDPKHAKVLLYCDKQTGGENSIIHWIKIEEGTEKTEYTVFTEEKAQGSLVGLTQYDMWNGRALNGYSSALWLGGKSSNAPFRVTKEGKLTATDANITGTITATAGKIGNLILSNGKLFKMTYLDTVYTSGINTTYSTGSNNTIFLWAKAQSLIDFSQSPFKEDLDTSISTWPNSTEDLDTSKVYQSSDGKYHYYAYDRTENGKYIYEWKEKTSSKIWVNQTITRRYFENNTDWSCAKALIESNSNFYVTHGGILHAKGAVISGNITLEEGSSINWDNVNAPSISNIADLTNQLTSISSAAKSANDAAVAAQDTADGAANTAATAQSDINNLPYVGSNLVRNSKNPQVTKENNQTSYWSGDYKIEESNGLKENCFVIADTEKAADGYRGKVAKTDYIKVEPEKKYTVSMLVWRYSGVSSMDLLFFYRAKDSTKDYDSYISKAKIKPTAGKWEKVVWTFEMPSNADEGYLRVDNNGWTGAADTTKTLWFTNVKFEEGNRATDWSAAPEDVDQKITETKNELTAAYENYANQEISNLDKAVANYLGVGGNTLITEKGLISPYIGGGYLNIANGKKRVIIDPSNKTDTGYIFQVHNGKSISVGIDKDGNAIFAGKIETASGKIGNLALNNGTLVGSSLREQAQYSRWISGINTKYENSGTQADKSIFLWCSARGYRDCSTIDGKKVIKVTTTKWDDDFRIDVANKSPNVVYYMLRKAAEGTENENTWYYFYNMGTSTSPSWYRSTSSSIPYSAEQIENIFANDSAEATRIVKDTAKFYVTQEGELHASNTFITGEITASKLTLTGNAEVPATKVTGLSKIATSNSYTDLDNKPTIPTVSVKKETATTSKGITTQKITVDISGSKTEYTAITNGGFLVVDQPKGTQNTSNHNSNYFKVSTEGLLTADNAVIWGEINATSGTIGNLKLSNSKLYRLTNLNNANSDYKYYCSGINTKYASNTGDLIFLWAAAKIKKTDEAYNTDATANALFGNSNWIKAKDLILETANFYVTQTGEMLAAAGKIGGWKIARQRLYSLSSEEGSSAGLYLNSPDYTSSNAWISATNAKGVRTFAVLKAGTLYATGADISGEITATEGYIGGTSGWTIKTKAIYNGTTSMTSTTKGTYIGTDGFRNYSSSSAYVNIQNGIIKAVGAELQGSIISYQATDFKGYSSLYSNLNSNATISFGGKITDGTVKELAYMGLTGTTKNGIHSLAISNNGNTRRYELILDNNDFAHRFLGDICIGNMRANESYPIALMMMGDYGTIVSDQGYFGNITSSYNLEGSDERLKKDILPLGNLTRGYSLRGIPNEDTSEKLFDSLIPVSYKRINEESRTSYGLIAQQILEALNECGLSEQDSDLVHETTFRDGEKYYAVNYNNFISLLIHEVQKLKKRVNELEQNQN